MRKPAWILTILLVTATAIAQTSRSQTPTEMFIEMGAKLPNCTTKASKAYAAKVLDLLERLSDARQLATSTPRGNLSGPVASLQTISREAQRLAEPKTVPACLRVLAMSAQLDASEAVIDLLCFMRNPDCTLSPKLVDYSAVEKAEKLRLGLP